MDNDKIFMVTIHVVAGVLMTAVCWAPAIVGNISVWKNCSAPWQSFSYCGSTTGASNMNHDTSSVTRLITPQGFFWQRG